MSTVRRLLLTLLATGLAAPATAGAVAIETFGRGIPRGARPTGIASDGHALWFTEAGTDRIGEITTRGRVRHYGGLSAGAQPDAIARGADGAMWFTEPGLDRIGRIAPDGTVREFAAGIPPHSELTGLARGPGGMWFNEYATGTVARISATGRVTNVSVAPNTFPSAIARGHDGAMWVAVYTGTRDLLRISPGGAARYLGGSEAITALAPGPSAAVWVNGFTPYDAGPGIGVGRVTRAGRIVRNARPLTPEPVEPGPIAAGPDGNLWFTDLGTDVIARATPDGRTRAFGPGIGGERGPGLLGIVAGPDGAMWFTERYYDRIGRITTARRDCVVPSVARRILGGARHRLARAGCRLGRTSGKGAYVAAQGPRAGRVLPYGARVRLVLRRHRPRAPHPPASGPCAAPPGARTIARSPVSAAYRRLTKYDVYGDQHAVWWACLLDSGPLRTLLRTNYGSVYDGESIDTVLLAGDLVGYERSSFDHYGAGGWTMVVRDLRTGQRVASIAVGFSGGDSYSGAEIPASLRLNARGDVAWLASESPARALVLHLHHGGADTTIDSGPLGSLHQVTLSESALSWTHDGVARSYALP